MERCNVRQWVAAECNKLSLQSVPCVHPIVLSVSRGIPWAVQTAAANNSVLNFLMQPAQPGPGPNNV